MNGRDDRSESPRIPNLGEQINVRVKLIRPFVESTDSGARQRASPPMDKRKFDSRARRGKKKKKKTKKEKKTKKNRRRELLDIDGNIR